MKKQQLTNLLQHPKRISKEDTLALEALLQTYPYLQPAYALYLKGLKGKNSFKYNSILKKTAAYTTDRSVLFDFITSDVFNQNKISEEIKSNSEYLKSIEVDEEDDISVNHEVMIDDDLQKEINKTEGILNPDFFQTKEEQTAQESIETHDKDFKKEEIEIEENSALSPEEKLNIGHHPLEFDKSENHSFLKWLQLTSFKPIERVKNDENNTSVSSQTKAEEINPSALTKDKKTAPLEDKLAIIDRFIEDNPKIKPTKDTPKPLVVKSDDTSETIMTETLARIYLEQKNYDKAIQSYKILSLKYPEKSSFFADQIKWIEELKNQS